MEINAVLSKARQAKREREWKYVWVSQGRIFIRKADRIAVLHVTSQADPAKVVYLNSRLIFLLWGMAMYCSVSELNSYVSGRHKQHLTFLHINMQSACSKEENFLLFLSEFNFLFSVIMMAEPWYRTETDVFRIDGYNVVYQDRKSKIGGGVCLHVKAGIT